MFGRILKKDLKRKKTINIILLLFVVMSSMFAASSVNNIIAVTKGLDFYFDKANVGDYVTIGIGDYPIEDALKDVKGIHEIKKEDTYAVPSMSDVKINGKKIKTTMNQPLLTSDKDAMLNYFNKDNEVISKVETGKIYASSAFEKKTDIKLGDTITIKLGSNTADFEFAGILKDAIFGSELVNNSHLLLNKSDFDALKDNDEAKLFQMKLCNIFADDPKAVESALSDIPEIEFKGTKEFLKLTYVMNMLVAGILLIASAGLVLVSFVMLGFTIKSTISEEFREIGVMKAVGIDNGSIRRLYMIKYLALSLLGAAIGFAASVPFGDMMLKSISDSMYLGNSSSILIGALCSAAVVAVILLFCYRTTSRIKKLSPIDAVRDGQTGERYGRRSLMHLGTSRLGATGFLALNDVLSSPKQFGMMTLVFTLLMLLITVISNFAYTLKSDAFLPMIGVTNSDVYFPFPDDAIKVYTEQYAGEKVSRDIEKTLAENGMPAKCSTTYFLNCKVKTENKSDMIRFVINREVPTENYKFAEGSAPSAPDEMALSTRQLSELGAKVGDRVKVNIGGEDKEFIITASYYSLNNTGRVGMFYKDTEFIPENVTGILCVQIDFDGDPDKETVEKNISRMKEIFDTDRIHDCAGFVNENTGVSYVFDKVKKMMTIVMIIIAALMTVLMERSFISKEKSEIALMKATGTENKSIIAHHTLRFAITGVAASIIASALTLPASAKIIPGVLSLLAGKIELKTGFDPVDIFAVSPAILIAVLTLGSMLTALYTNTITSSDTASIE
ncbi:MAG: FtsX-like permease family protein [Ruminococcus sp.]|nr:FtsX-like permease family protein [Ruminococcus sp.]